MELFAVGLVVVYYWGDLRGGSRWKGEAGVFLLFGVVGCICLGWGGWGGNFLLILWGRAAGACRAGLVGRVGRVRRVGLAGRRWIGALGGAVFFFLKLDLLWIMSVVVLAGVVCAAGRLASGWWSVDLRGMTLFWARVD